MTLREIKQAIDQLSVRQLTSLRQYIDEREQQIQQSGRGATPEERIERLRAARAALVEGLSDEDLAEMTAAMNEEYIEPSDDGLWQN